MRLPAIVTIKDVNEAARIYRILKLANHKISTKSLVDFDGDYSIYGAIRYLVSLGLIRYFHEYRPPHCYYYCEIIK